MRSAAGILFFMAMVPLGVPATELRTGGDMASNVPDPALQDDQHRFLQRRGGRRGGGGRRGRGDSTSLPSPAPGLPSATPEPTIEPSSPTSAPTAETPLLTPEPTAEVPSPPPEPPTTPDVPAPTPGPTAEVPSPTPDPTAELPSRTPAPTTEVSSPTLQPSPEPEVPSSTSEPSPAPTMDSGMELLLELHNEARCLHNADALTYSDDVATSAMAHAGVLTSSCGDIFHSQSEDRSGYGENLYLCGTTGSVTCYSPEGAMEALYETEIQADSVEDYGGHATQILWKSTTELGCAVLSCDSDVFMYTYLVCQYNPAGNLMVDLEYEVELLTDNNC